ncbi:MAG: response regulator, partial [Anaerostipes sp.]|nr:response regulator [Anaerostipes sp.]
KEGYYQVVLMDIRMPVMDGLEATKTIRSMNRQDAKKVPIIAMSANAYAEDRQKSFQAGMNEHLAKPVNPKELYQSLIKHLNS